MRLIDADAIRLPKGFFEKVNNVPKFYEWLSEQVTIDLMKYGKWIYSTNSESVCEEWTCNLCGAFSFEKTNFCYNCGADMRGKMENENK